MTREELTIIAECVKAIAVATKGVSDTVSNMSKKDVDLKMEILSALQHVCAGNVKLSKILEDQGDGIFVQVANL